MEAEFWYLFVMLADEDVAVTFAKHQDPNVLMQCMLQLPAHIKMSVQGYLVTKNAKDGKRWRKGCSM